MDDYLRRAKAALVEFQGALGAFETVLPSAGPAAGVSGKDVQRVAEIIARLRAAATRLQHSMTQISGDTALDVVDLQVRLEGETASLASALKALGELVTKVPAVLSSAGSTLYALEEAAARVAAAIFPNVVEGAREINRTLWDFRPLWNEYARTLAQEVTRPAGKGLSADNLARLEQTANQVRARFDDVNELLNQLVAGSANGPEVQPLIRQARHALAGAIREAKSRAADVYKPFHGVLKRAESLARKIDGQFAGLRVPVFPAAARLGELSGVLDEALYADLAGVERFALLNISARLRSISLADAPGSHLLSPHFAIRVFDVFPDRVYFTAEATFITAIQALRETRVFQDAPASLHRFKEGSFKQRQSGKGNLQLSYASGSPERPSDRTKVRVDADIDLYRSPVRHLFGEVLVNHLTGSRTDQFKVWDILAASNVRPIGGFDVVAV